MQLVTGKQFRHLDPTVKFLFPGSKMAQFEKFLENLQTLAQRRTNHYQKHFRNHSTSPCHRQYPLFL